MKTPFPLFKFTGQVIHGEKVGRTIGFPTANLNKTPDEKILKPGVYLGKADLYQEKKIIKKNLPALAYFGPRYIFGEKKNNFEVYLYNFTQDIYGYTLDIALTNFIRPPENFTHLDQLKQKLLSDKKKGQKLWAT